MMEALRLMDKSVEASVLTLSAVNMGQALWKGGIYMLEFASNTYLLEYRDGAYLCNGNKRVEAPLNLETLAEAVHQCPKLQQVAIDDAPFGDECFPILAQIPKLNMLALLRGGQIAGHGLELLKELPVKDLFLQRTALDNEGLSQAVQIKKLEKVYIAACRQVTFEGLMATSWRDKLWVIDRDEHDDEGRAGRFTQEQRKAYEDARPRYNVCLDTFYAVILHNQRLVHSPEDVQEGGSSTLYLGFYIPELDMADLTNANAASYTQWTFQEKTV